MEPKKRAAGRLNSDDLDSVALSPATSEEFFLGGSAGGAFIGGAGLMPDHPIKSQSREDPLPARARIGGLPDLRQCVQNAERSCSSREKGAHLDTCARKNWSHAESNRSFLLAREESCH
jgi:hypothetical protein